MRYFILDTILRTDVPNIPTSGYIIPESPWSSVVHPSGMVYPISYSSLSALIRLAVGAVIIEPCVWIEGESGAHTSLVAVSSAEYRQAAHNTQQRNMNIPADQRIPGHVYLASNTGKEVIWLGKIWRRTFTSPSAFKDVEVHARMENGIITGSKASFQVSEEVCTGTLPEMTKSHTYGNKLVIYSYDQLPTTPEVRVVENTAGMILQTVDGLYSRMRNLLISDEVLTDIGKKVDVFHHYGDVTIKLT